MNLIQGFNAIINQDEYNAYSIFESRQLREDIGKPEIVKAIYDLTTKGSNCTDKSLNLLFEDICNCFNLFENSDHANQFK